MSNVTVQDYRVESSIPDVGLLVRNKRRAGTEPAATVLFVHGATYPSTATFDYPIDGRSWMDGMAAAGFDAWCVDLAGYGGSDRPPEMAVPAADNGPIVDTEQAIGDVARVVDFILARRGLPHLALIGYSWGTAIAGGYAAANPAKVDRLVLSGALWCRPGSAGIMTDGPLGAYRTVDAAAAAKRWVMDLTPAQIDAVGAPGHIEAWSNAAIAGDPEASRHDPPLLRAPTGVVKDVRDYWLQEKPTYDPAAILAPTLVVVGEWDRETTPEQGRAVFDRLDNAADRRYVVIGRGTHSLLLEKQRAALHGVVEGFLKECWGG